jgi:hypothetical protein
MMSVRMAGSREREAEAKARPSPRRKSKPSFSPASPWTTLPRDIHRLWILGIASSVCGVVFLASSIEAIILVDAGRPFDGRVAGTVVVSMAFAVLLLLEHNRRRWQTDPMTRFFEWMEWTERKEAKGATERTAPPRRGKAPPSEPMGTAFWMGKLSERLARLKRFKELDAPASIVEQEHRLIREAIAELNPGEALSAMRSWPELVRLFERKKRTDKPDAQRN